MQGLNRRSWREDPTILSAMQQASHRYGVPLELIEAVIEQESSRGDEAKSRFLRCLSPALEPALAALRAAVRPTTPLVGVLVHGGAIALGKSLDQLDALDRVFLRSGRFAEICRAHNERYQCSTGEDEEGGR